MTKPWTFEQIDELIADIRDDIEQFSSGGADWYILDLISVHDLLRTEVERLKAAVTDLGVLHTQDYVEIERLRVALGELDVHRRLAEDRAQEIERLRAVAETMERAVEALVEHDPDCVDCGYCETRDALAGIASKSLNAFMFARDKRA